MRPRYRLVAGLMYIGLGGVILVRALLAHVVPLTLLGVVFVALGVVQVRAFLSWRRMTSGR